MKIKDFEGVAKQIQLNLIEYLAKQGIRSDKNFKCINPKHADSSPSMSVIKPEGIRFYCHGCGVTGDIFDACHFLENKPLTGDAYINDTFMHLANMFSIEVEHTELTEDEIYELDTYRAYKYAYDLITSWNKDTVPVDIKAEFDKRKWSEESYSELRSMGLGFVLDHAEFREKLKTLGFSAKFLDDVDLNRKDIFSPGHLIYTVKDEHGKPVGFAAKNLTDIGPKYVNQKTTGVKCNIYKKGKRLYGLDRALKDKHTGPVYVVEGYADVVTPHLNGLNRVVATCSTSLTDDHLYLLKDLGIYNIVLCYDGDNAGQTRTEELLDEKFPNHKEINVKVANLPTGNDPDEFIRHFGIEAFSNIVLWTAFQWRLNRFEDEADPELICKKMMPHIVNEPSHISQEKMIQELSKHTGFSLKTLQSELNRLVNDKERARDRDRQSVIEKAVYSLKQTPSEAEIILNETSAKLFNLQTQYDNNGLSEDSTLKFIQDIKNFEEEKLGDYQGFVLGEDLHEIQELVLSGDWIRDVLLVFGGKANTGKTSLMVKLATSIALQEANNACVIYHTIDDTKEQVLPKFVCVAEGSTKLQINEVKSPVYYKNHEGQAVYEDIQYKREQGYESLLNLTRNGRLIIKDANDGSSLAYAESLIRFYQEKYPDRKVIYFLDNFHKLRDFGDMGDERTRFKTMSTVVKGIATKYHIPVICTMEYTKLKAGERPTNDNIAETVQMEYDANLIVHLYNEMHESGDRAAPETYHSVEERSGPVRRPIIEMIVGKNKISSFKSSIWLKFYPPSSDFKPHPLNIALASREQMENRARRRNSNERTLPSEGLFS
jgi:DNA primase catalytic core